MSCPSGHTKRDLEIIFPNGDDLADFYTWMNGQTMTLCDGRKYNHDAKEYQISACGDEPHGVVVFSSDFEDYLAGFDPAD
jgi:hypothetical protein